MEIPVKKKSAFPWWLWLVAAVLLLGLLWWLLAGRGDDAADGPVAAAPEIPAATAASPPYAAGPPETTVESAAVGAGEPVTDLATLLEAGDRRALIGREFQLTGVRVLDVVGDRTFWVGDEDRRVFAALREAPPPGWPTDADININPRQTVNIRGAIADASSGDLAGRPLQNMPPGTDIVLFAQAAEVITRP